MRKSTQALLWSAVIFPGAGHLLLKAHKRGMALIALSLLSLGWMMVEIFRLSNQTIEQTLQAGGSLDLWHLVAVTQLAVAQDYSLSRAIWILILCWVLGMVDAYFLGKKLEQ